MTRQCLVYVYATQNMLPAIAAVRWHGIQQYAEEHADVTTLLHMPGWNENRLAEATAIITKLCASQNWPAPIVVTQTQIDHVVAGASNVDLSDKNILNRFREVLGKGENAFQEVYYSHDIVGHVAQLCMRAYPQATSITYGESLGMMEDTDYVLACSTGSGWDESKKHERIKKNKPTASKAVLILPMDQTGDCLDQKQLLIVPRLLALAVISDFQKVLPEIETYSRALLKDKPEPYFLFASSNAADANFTTPELEVAMYEEMIRRNVPKGATVVLKGHPLATIPIDQMLSERLKDTYHIALVSPELNRYPMEIWQYLIEHCQVIAWSYCSVSLEYFFEKSVIYPLDVEQIEKYLSPRIWTRMKDWDDACRGQRQCLKKWEGRGVIWSGKRTSFPPLQPPPSDAATPTNIAELKNRYGVALFQSGKPQEALEALHSALMLSPNDAGIHCNIGIVHWHLGSSAQALEYLTRARTISPHDASLVLTICQMCRALGKNEEAKSLCTSFLSEHPTNINVLQFSAEIS